jgi:hypothetical protein
MLSRLADQADEHVAVESLCPGLSTTIPLSLPSPDLKNPGHTEDGSAIGSELIEVRHDTFDFLR